MATTDPSPEGPEPPLSPPPHPNWLDLPREITSKILLNLGAVEILLNAQSVCSQWRSISKDPSMWRTVNTHNIGRVYDLGFDPDKICREAVNRSSGNLSSISLEYFATDDILNYITDRCKNIRHLRLVQCVDVSDEGLCGTAAKLPLLAELELSYCEFSGQTIRSVGLSCPLLKSFKLNCTGFRHPHIEIDDDAQAIAESMPQLRCLQLFGNKLTNQGLKAILFGCPNLESLDLRQCFNVNLGSILGKTCAEKIKNIRHPYDHTDDYEFDATLNDNYLSDDELMIADYVFEEDFPLEYSDLDLVSGEEDEDDDASYDGSDGSFNGDNLDFDYD